MNQTITIRVSGKVQGVFYRKSAAEKARELGITGFVKNMPDDSVMIVATGDKEVLDQLSAWCRKGPSRARVENIDIQDVPLKEFLQFTIDR